MPPKTGPKVLIFGKGGISQGIRDALPKCRVTELTRDQADVYVPYDVAHSLGTHEPDWVVNCAGVSNPGPSHNFWAEVEINLIGAMTVGHLASQRDIPQIHIASVAGLYGKPNHMGYSASKAGVISMVQSLAMEGKQAWAISPGRVDTLMRQKDYPNDTPGSRLMPIQVGAIVRQIMDGKYESGTNVVIRKQGLTEIIIEEHKGDGWREKLKVGEPVTI